MRWSRRSLATIILQFTSVIPIVFTQCPELRPPCICAPSIYEPVAIVCTNAGSLQNVLRAIEGARDVVVDSLLISDTPIPTLPASAFESFTILRLVLVRDTLNSIDERAFDGPLLDSLVELDLSDNQIGTVPQTGISRLRNLRKLYLNRNHINQLPSNSFQNYVSSNALLKLELAGNLLTDEMLENSQVFRPLISLQQLSLETNAIRIIPSAALAGQRYTLTNLNLGLNQINDVAPGALDFPNLTSLSLEFNGITQIIPEAFQGVQRLQYLYLTGNKFPSWRYEMFRYIGELRTLAIGETPVTVIPSNAFQYIPKLVRLEMSEAAVNKIEKGVFQRAPNIQAIILNKNRLPKIRTDFFAGLNHLYSVNVEGNRIEQCEELAFANLPSISHLDISNNQLQTLPDNVFLNSFLPLPDDRRTMYVCGNPWLCNSALDWFRKYLRDNIDIDIDKPGCLAVCKYSVNNCPPPDTPLRDDDPEICGANEALPLTGSALSMVGWIILAIIMTILLISIVLLAFVRYGMSYRRKKLKDNNELSEEQQRITSSSNSVNQVGTTSVITHINAYDRPSIDLDLPAAYSLDDRPSGYLT